jgi:hypothetical protein
MRHQCTEESGTAIGPRRGEVVRLLAGELPESFVREVRAVPADPLFRWREGLNAAYAGKRHGEERGIENGKTRDRASAGAV